MLTSTINERLAVCTWSLQPQSPAELLSHLCALGIPRVQLALDPIVEGGGDWSQCANCLKAEGITVVSGMFGTYGEDYQTLETIKETGGVVPDVHWERNWSHIQKTAALAGEMGLSLVTFHAGFLPHDPSDEAYEKLKGRIERIAGAFAEHGMDVALETGQETAETLKMFLEALDCKNVGVNFDPANMLLYGKGEPIAAMKVLAPWIKQVHIKDAIASTDPGQWGQEVVVGTGQVDWTSFFVTLKEIGFTGNLSIEREAGSQRVADILTAKSYVEGIVK